MNHLNQQHKDLIKELVLNGHIEEAIRLHRTVTHEEYDEAKHQCMDIACPEGVSQ